MSYEDEIFDFVSYCAGYTAGLEDVGGVNSLGQIKHDFGETQFNRGYQNAFDGLAPQISWKE